MVTCGPMKLSLYLSENGISFEAFAQKLGRSRQAVERYAAGKRIPDRETMPLIAAATGGIVGPADFYDLPPEPDAAAAPPTDQPGV